MLKPAVHRINSHIHFKMAAPLQRILSRLILGQCTNYHLARLPVRCLQTTAICHKTVAGRVKVSKGEKPITYEQANPPFQIGVRKGWSAQHTANLKNEHGAADHALDDLFIRKFIYGTFHNCLATDLIIKRRANQITLVGIMLRNLAPQKYYFLIGYTEELLSHWFKCPVKVEIQIVDDRPIYKWI